MVKLRNRFFKRRPVWCLTRPGWAVIGLIVVGLLLVWALCGEPFLSVNQVLPADVLVVEGWIGPEAMAAAVREFERGGYREIVTGGCSTEGGWVGRGSNYADLAADELTSLGVPAESVTSAPAGDHVTQRTWSTAVAVRRELEGRGPLPGSINVITRGCHARRSRLVFSKVLGDDVKVGVIPWLPEHERSKPWWRSSERAKDFLDETVSYLCERLFNCGRPLSRAAE